MIYYNTILEVTDDEVAICLLLNPKYIVIVVEPVSPVLNMPHSMILVFYETNVIYYQYNTEAATYHYLLQNNAASYISIYFIQIF